MKKVTFDEEMEMFNKNLSEGATGNNWSVAQEALWQARENRKNLDSLLEWINKHEERSKGLCKKLRINEEKENEREHHH